MSRPSSQDAGVSVPSHRHRAIVLDVLQTIKCHGATGDACYLPGCLAHCVQEHFKHHGDEYYAEAKALRTLTGDVIDVLAKLPRRDGPGLVETLAALRADLKPRRRRTKEKPTEIQPSLFGAAM